MKNNSSFHTSETYGSQGSVEGVVNVLNLMEVVSESDAASFGSGGCDYFSVLCQQSFPGPLVGGSVGNKELNKWIDDKIANCETPYMDLNKGEHLRLHFSVLKISWQFYGKLRSPFGTDQRTKVVLVAQIVCWTVQFIDHGGFEKRAPAWLDNLAQAFIMAHFFVLLEVMMEHLSLSGAHVYVYLNFATMLLLPQALQSIFGYEPYPGFHARVQARVDVDISAWKENKQRLVS